MDDLTSKVENLAGKQNELEKLTSETYESFKSFVQEIKSKYKYIYKKGICGIKKYETKYLSVHYPNPQLYITFGNYADSKVIFNPALYKKNWAFNKADIK